MGDAALARELSSLFADWVATQVGNLRDPSASVREVCAHAMRGAALNIGALALAGALKEVEDDPRSAAACRAAIEAAERTLEALERGGSGGAAVDLADVNL